MSERMIARYMQRAEDADRALSESNAELAKQIDVAEMNNRRADALQAEVLKLIAQVADLTARLAAADDAHDACLRAVAAAERERDTLTAAVAQAREENDQLRQMLAHSIDLFITPGDYRPGECPICTKINDWSIDLADALAPPPGGQGA